MLIQKTTTLTLSSPQRITKLIPISLSAVLVVKAKDLEVWNIGGNVKEGKTDVREWEVDGRVLGEGFARVIDAVWQPNIRRILVLLATRSVEKHQGWVFVSTSLTQNKDGYKFEPIVMHHSFDKNPTKNEQMQLVPKIIKFPLCQYFILLRQFYNESLVTVFKNTAKQEEMSKDVYNFFVNQENLGCFDQGSKLVSFRSLFDRVVSFEIFDVGMGAQWESKKKDKLNDRERRDNIKTRVQVDINNSGVVMAIKQVNCAQKQPLDSCQNFQALLSINWRNKSTQYLLYSHPSNTITVIVNSPQPQPNTLTLSHFLKIGNMMCTLQYEGRKIGLVYERWDRQVGNRNVYPVEEQLEEWEVSRLQGGDFVIASYSQLVGDQSKIQCHFYRNMGKKEMTFALARQTDISPSIFETLLQLTS